MKKRVVSVLSIYSILLVFLLVLPMAFSVNVNSCRTITSPGTYTLTTDIVNHNQNRCFNIQSDNVIFDCQNHVIDSNGYADYGFYLYGNYNDHLTGIQIRNCRLTDWDGYGMYLYYVDSSTFTNIDIENGKDYGLYVYDSDSNTFSDLVVRNHPYYGLYVSSSDGNTFRSSTIELNGLHSDSYYGVYLDYSKNNIFFDNTFNNAQNFEIYSNSDEYQQWDNGVQGNYYSNPSNSGYSDICSDSNGNNICDSGYVISSTSAQDSSGDVDRFPKASPSSTQTVPGGGIAVENCVTITHPGTYYLTKNIIDHNQNRCFDIQSDNVIFDCQNRVVDSNGNADYGFYLYGNYNDHLTGIQVRNCRLTDWDGYGMYLYYTDSSTFSNIDIENGKDYGLYVYDSDSNTFSDLAVRNHPYYGLYVSSSDGNTFRSSTVELNGLNSDSYYGVYLDYSKNNIFFDNTFNNARNFEIYRNANEYQQWDNGALGNYYTHPSSNGYSDICSDSNGNQICDSGYVIPSTSSQDDSGDTDRLPKASPSSSQSIPGGGTALSRCTTITTPGTYYLTNDIIDHNQNRCFDIQSDNVVFDCQNHIVDSNGYADYGFYIYGNYNDHLTGIEVKNCRLTDWDGYGMYLYYTSSSTFTNNRIENGKDYGLYVYESNSNTFDTMYVRNHPYYGLYLSSSNDNTFRSSTFELNGGSSSSYYGLYLDYVDDNIFFENIFNNTRNFEIYTSSNEHQQWDNGVRGNYYTNPTGIGYSDTCPDANGNQICDSAFTIATGDVDRYPLKSFLIPQCGNGVIDDGEECDSTAHCAASNQPNACTCEIGYHVSNNLCLADPSFSLPSLSTQLSNPTQDTYSLNKPISALYPLTGDIISLTSPYLSTSTCGPGNANRADNTACTFSSSRLDCTITLDSGFSAFDTSLLYYACAYVNGAWLRSQATYLEIVTVCSDTKVSGTEECDDGNTNNGDGCNSVCLRELYCSDFTLCGNGDDTDPGEECDDGNKFSGDGCDQFCLEEVCGDNVVQPNGRDGVSGTADDEECEPGIVNGGCSINCKRI